MEIKRTNKQCTHCFEKNMIQAIIDNTEVDYCLNCRFVIDFNCSWTQSELTSFDDTFNKLFNF